MLGRSGRIAAVLFGYPPQSPPGRERNDKILRVARTPPGRGALWIRARRLAEGRPVGARVWCVVADEPGPSIVNLPAAGCRRLALACSGGSDTLDLAHG